MLSLNVKIVTMYFMLHQATNELGNARQFCVPVQDLETAGNVCEILIKLKNTGQYPVQDILVVGCIGKFNNNIK